MVEGLGCYRTSPTQPINQSCTSNLNSRFHNDGAENVYLSSADWMDRNFFRRIEICFPLLEPRLKKRVIREGLTTLLSRNAEAWEMDADGNYRLHKGKRGRGGHPQMVILNLLTGKPAR